MNAADLRASILQAAIEGKLVPQLESEPEVKQIGEELDNTPFEIPQKWKWLRLIFLVEKARQKVPDKVFHYVDVSSINSSKNSINKMAVIEAKQAPSRARKIVKEGMVLFSTVRPYLKNICLALDIPQETIASTAFATFSCGAYLNNCFALYVLTSPYFMKYVSQVQKGVAYPAISDKDFYSAYIPVPPLAEQRRIVAQLNKLLPLVDEFGEAQKALEVAQTEFPSKLKASLLQAAIEGKLVPQLESEPEVKQIGEAPVDVPFEIPKKWKWVHVTAVQTLIRGITFPASAKNKEPKAGLIQCLTTGSVQQTYRSASDVYVKSEFVKNNKQYLKQGDVVLSSANSRELVGKNILWECNADNKTSFGGFLTVARSRSDALTSEFAYIIYQYLFISGKFMEIATQTTNIANISNKVLSEVVLPIPPLAEQRRIVARLNELLPLLDDLH